MSSTITPMDFWKALEKGEISEIIDVRNIDEFAAAPVEGPVAVPTRNVPVYRVMEELEEEAALAQEQAVVICGQGNGSELVTYEFASLGKHTVSLEGGTEAWQDLLVPRKMEGLPEPLVAYQFLRPAKGCVSYLIGIPGESCVVVDPARHYEPYLELALEHEMKVAHVVDTHVHADHISGGPHLAQAVMAEYHLPPEDAGDDLPFDHRPFVDGEEIEIGAGHHIEALVMHLPGHTPGTTALLIAGKLLLVGDTVFVRGLGRPDLTGQAEELARDLFASVHERLEPLAPDTIIAPAHWSTWDELDQDGMVLTTRERVFEATLLNEKAIEAFVQEIIGTLPSAPDTYDTIRLVNAGKQQVSDEDLTVLDIGKNQCAAASTLT
jgi:glyoxylase-like metal-dependent hydrolase (beta-lactamase superfamily II)